MSRRSLRNVGAALATAALFGLTASAAGGQGGAGRIVYGYPYTAHCPGAGIAEVVDRWGMYACNCTSYVAWALSANGQSIDWFIRGSMDAWNWPNVARLRGLTVRRTPSAGDVAVWPKLGGHLGHVAYVTAVHPGGTFDVAEYNLPLLAHTSPFGFDRRSFVSRAGAVFVVVPRDD